MSERLKKLRRAAWVSVICVGAAYAGYWASQNMPRSGAQEGTLAPDFALNDLDGKLQRLSDYRGKLVLVNFWATWCAPCIEELPLLVEAQTLYGPRGLQILGPAMDEHPATQALAKSMGVNYPVMADYAQIDGIMRALGNEIGALPYSVLVDAEGKILRSFLGGLKRSDLQQLAQDHLPS